MPRKPLFLWLLKKGSEFYQRLKQIPHISVTGSAPGLWKAVIRPMEEHSKFDIRIIAADYKNQNPSRVSESPNILEDISLDIGEMKKRKGYHGAPLWIAKDCYIKNKKYGQIKIDVLNKNIALYGKSNPIKPELFDGMQVYFGDIHGQSQRSIGFGSDEEYFAWARDAELLDFTAPANHYGGRERLTEEIWEETKELCNKYEDPGHFSTMVSYEWGGRNGHRNVYYRDKIGDILVGKKEEGAKCDTIQKLWGALGNQGLPALTIPHHPKFISRVDWSISNPEYQRVVEVCSCWGNSEQHGPHSVQHAIKLGHRMGVIGGTDTHFSQPGHSCFGAFDRGGLTVVIAPKLERTNIWDALHDRRCYATTWARILVSFFINNSIMGSELHINGERKISGEVIGTADLKSVEIIRNNKVIHCINPKSDEAKVDFIDKENFSDICLKPEVFSSEPFIFYYLRVIQKDEHWAMSSPIWIS